VRSSVLVEERGGAGDDVAAGGDAQLLEAVVGLDQRIAELLDGGEAGAQAVGVGAEGWRENDQRHQGGDDDEQAGDEQQARLRVCWTGRAGSTGLMHGAGRIHEGHLTAP
jgi:hypothetical protein